jgi:hypothetical protein
MKKLLVIPLIIAGISILVLAGCSKEKKAGEIKVGVVQAQTGTNHLRGNSALRSRGFGLPSRVATGTKSFAVNRKQSFEVKRNLSVGMISQTNVAAAADLGAAGRRTPRHAGLRSSADDLPVRLSATTS